LNDVLESNPTFSESINAHALSTKEMTREVSLEAPQLVRNDYKSEPTQLDQAASINVSTKPFSQPDVATMHIEPRNIPFTVDDFVKVKENVSATNMKHGNVILPSHLVLVVTQIDDKNGSIWVNQINNKEWEHCKQIMPRDFAKLEVIKSPIFLESLFQSENKLHANIG
jgi:hypothetical protein